MVSSEGNNPAFTHEIEENHEKS